jgi:hypothetical protein
MPNLRSSLSTNDIPTVNSMNGTSSAGANLTHAAQHLHNHNANMGRIPSAVNRHSRDLSSSELRTADSFQAFPTTTAPPAFNLAATTMATATNATVKIEPGTGPNAASNLPYPYYGQSGNNFGMQGGQQYSAAPQYSQYSPYYWQQQQQQFGMNKVRDSQPMVVASRRNQGDGDGQSSHYSISSSH